MSRNVWKTIDIKIKHLLKKFFNKTNKRRRYPPDTRYIHDYMSRIPFDNENELKTIVVAILFFIISYFIIKFTIYSSYYN